MAENLQVRAFKNFEGKNKSGTLDYWIYNDSNLVSVYLDISDKYDSDYVLKLYKKESKQKSAPIDTETVKPTKPSKKKETPANKEISNFFE